MKIYSIPILVLWLFPLFVEGQNGSRVTLAVKELHDINQTVELEASQRVSPGTVATFSTSSGKIHIKIWRALSVDLNIPLPRYLAKIYLAEGEAKLGDLKPGDLAETDPLLSFPPGVSNTLDYWKKLINPFNESNNSWLIMNNQKLEKGEVVDLSAQLVPVEGYLCLLEIRNNKRIIVHHPSTYVHQAMTGKTGKIPIRPFVQITTTDAASGIIGQKIRFKKGYSTYIAIISSVPRPLSDFLPKVFQEMKYYDAMNMLKLDPWQIGPGFYDPKNVKKQIRNPDLLPGDSWTIQHINIRVRW